MSHYDKLKVLNLLSQTTAEAQLSEEFAAQMATLRQNSAIKYSVYDFNTETKGSNFGVLSSLARDNSKDLKDFGVCIQTQGEIAERQTGVFRINCLDCLDR